MIKNYYAILGIVYPSSLDEITMAYREMAKRWHPDLHPGEDVAKRMVDINEAAEILRDPQKKARYDAEYMNAFSSSLSTSSEPSGFENYHYEYKDETLHRDVYEARRKAEEYVRELFNELKKSGKDAAKGAWSFAKPFIIILLTLLVSVPFFTGFIKGVKSTTADNYSPESGMVSSTKSLNASSEAWKTYSNNSYSISYPKDWLVFENPDQMSDVYVGSATEAIGFTILHFETDYSLSAVMKEIRENSISVGMIVSSDKEVNISGGKGYRHVLTYKLGDMNIKQIGYTVKKGSTIFNVKFGSDKYLIDNNIELINKMIASFRTK